jgi:hypothetical protein
MFADKITKKLVKAVIYTVNNLKVEGSVFAGTDVRLSDEFNISGKKLIFIKDVTVTVLGTETSMTYEMMFINKDQIVMVAPQD